MVLEYKTIQCLCLYNRNILVKLDNQFELKNKTFEGVVHKIRQMKGYLITWLYSKTHLVGYHII